MTVNNAGPNPMSGEKISSSATGAWAESTISTGTNPSIPASATTNGRCGLRRRPKKNWTRIGGKRRGSAVPSEEDVPPRGRGTPGRCQREGPPLRDGLCREPVLSAVAAPVVEGSPAEVGAPEVSLVGCRGEGPGRVAWRRHADRRESSRCVAGR